MSAQARRAVEARFAADLARRHPGTVWRIEAAREPHSGASEALSDEPQAKAA